jgi:lysophospholipase L1-like esterase
MRKLLPVLCAAIALQCPLSAQELPAPAKNKYEDAVAKFALAPAPAPGGVLLVGSSIFRKWTTSAADLAPIPVTNRAFGGSRTGNQLTFFDRVVPSSRAGLVVWYCGSNDIKGGIATAVILDNTKQWIERTRGALPGARILLVSVIRAIQKREDGQLDEVDEVNAGLRQLAETMASVDYVDVNPALESASGEAIPGCYLADKLHLSPDGYRRLVTVLRPAIEKGHSDR